MKFMCMIGMNAYREYKDTKHDSWLLQDEARSSGCCLRSRNLFITTETTKGLSKLLEADFPEIKWNNFNTTRWEQQLQLCEGMDKVIYRSAGFISGCQKNSRIWHYQGVIFISQNWSCVALYLIIQEETRQPYISCTSSKPPNAGRTNWIQHAIPWHADNEPFLINLPLASVLNFLCKCIQCTFVRAQTTSHILWKSVKLAWIK